MKTTATLLFLFFITSCSVTGEALIYGNPFSLTDDDVEELLGGVSVLSVSENQLAGFCPQAAVRSYMAGLNLADCVVVNPTRVYILANQSYRNATASRRHAASHIYDVQFLGATPEQSARHEGW